MIESEYQFSSFSNGRKIVYSFLMIGIFALLLSSVFLVLIFPFEEESVNNILNLATNGIVIGVLVGLGTIYPAILELIDAVRNYKNHRMSLYENSNLDVGTGVLILYCIYGIIIGFILSTVNRFAEFTVTAGTNGLKISVVCLAVAFIALTIITTVFEAKAKREYTKLLPEGENNEH